MPAVFRFAPSRCAHIPTRLSTIGEQNLPEGNCSKAKGQAPLRELAPSSDLSKIWLGFQITTHCHFSMVRNCQLSLASPIPSVIASVAQAFSVSIRMHPVS
jgi:hypothetical protein